MTHATVVDLVGGLDLASVARWEAEVGRAASTSSAVVLDLSGVDFLDSAGVNGLFRMLAAVDGQGKRFAIVAPREGRVRRLLEILDVPSVARICESRDEALRDAE